MSRPQTGSYPRAATAVALAVVVVVAGCAGAGGGTGSRATDVASETAGTPAPGGTWDGRLVVTLAPGTPDRVEPALQAAAAGWRTNGSRYLGRDVAVVVESNASDPDVVVRVTDRVPNCGGVDDAVGCAPVVTADDTPSRPVTIWLQAGLRHDSARRVLEHELGHVLGLEHGDAPEGVMRRVVPLRERPQPDAARAPVAWPDRTLTVHVDAANATNPAGVRTQVRLALGYLADGPPGVRDGWRFRIVTESAAADVDVRFTNTTDGPCQTGAASCVRLSGPDPDGDGAAETYRQLTVTLVEIETAAVGWHVGYWLSGTLGQGPRPPVFRDADYGDRRGRWWEETRTPTPG
jgi:hypothetical protein